MLRPRIIPFLLMKDGQLFKTIGFKDPKYVGDPINAVKIFNEKNVDELALIDIDASSSNKEPDFDLIKKVARESRMPFTYGGGISTLDHAKKLVASGVEKVALSSAYFNYPNVLSEISKVIGNQSLVLVIDVKKNSTGDYKIYTHNGEIGQKKDLVTFLNESNNLPIGELVINNIERDGFMNGYDFDLISIVREIVDYPITVLGGAKDHNDLKVAIERFKIIGLGVGSLFVFKGIYKAVLINYPNQQEKSFILGNQ